MCGAGMNNRSIFGFVMSPSLGSSSPTRATPLFRRAPFQREFSRSTRLTSPRERAEWCSGSLDQKRTVASPHNALIQSEHSHPPASLSSVEQRQPLAVFQKTAPTPAPIKKRGSEGGKGANLRPDYFKDQIIQCLENLPKPRNKYPSIVALFDAAFFAIERTVEEFHAYLESAENKGPNRVTYGKTTRATGVLRKLRKWAKEDPQFRERLSKLCEVKGTNRP